jgi:hypothetical protein
MPHGGILSGSPRCPFLLKANERLFHTRRFASLNEVGLLVFNRQFDLSNRSSTRLLVASSAFTSGRWSSIYYLERPECALRRRLAEEATDNTQSAWRRAAKAKRRQRVCGVGQASSGRWMSLKVGTSLESHSSMIFPQTTHFAILLSFAESRERVTE